MTAMPAAHDSAAAVPARPGVAERLTQILDVFASGPETVLLEDVIRITELPRSTAFRLLTQLVQLEWLEHDSSGYRLGAMAARLGGGGARTVDHAPLRAAAAQPLNDLHLATGAVAHLAVLERGSVHFLDKIGGPFVHTVPSHVGRRLPAIGSMLGLALLANETPEQVDNWIPNTTPRQSVWEQASLHGTLNKVRQRRGIALIAAQHSQHNIGVVATTVNGPHGSVASIGLAGLGLEQVERFAPLVAQAAARTSKALYPHWQHEPRRGRGRGRLTAS